MTVDHVICLVRVSRFYVSLLLLLLVPVLRPPTTGSSQTLGPLALAGPEHREIGHRTKCQIDHQNICQIDWLVAGITGKQ